MYCASKANARFHGHYSPWKQTSAFAHTWRWRCSRTAAAWNNKLFQGQIADKNPFFHPTKKDQERGKETEQDRERKAEIKHRVAYISLKLDLSLYFVIILIYSPTCLQLLSFLNSYCRLVVLGEIAWYLQMNERGTCIRWKSS